MTEPRPRVSVIVLAFGDEPLLDRCIEATRASLEVEVEVILVDNGCLDRPLVSALSSHPEVSLVDAGRNLGFAAGVNLGVRASSGEFVVLLNSDAIPEPEALWRLIAPLADHSVGLTTASLRLLRQPHLMNSCGNPVHFAGLSWAGCFGEPVAEHVVARPVASASGAAMACRRETWDRLGGLCEEMFAYHEDTEISPRCWGRGLSVWYVPDAVVLHDYEFSRNVAKLGLLERNRLITVLTVYQRRTLLILAPFLLTLEPAIALLALRQGWFRGKAVGWLWLVRNLKWIRDRRKSNKEARLVSDAQLIPVLTASFEPGQQLGGPGLRAFNVFARTYWVIAARFIRLVR